MPVVTVVAALMPEGLSHAKSKGADTLLWRLAAADLLIRILMLYVVVRLPSRQYTSSRLTVAAPSCSTRYAAMVPPESTRCAISSGSTRCSHICAVSGSSLYPFWLVLWLI